MSREPEEPWRQVRLDEIAELSAALPPATVRKIYAHACLELALPHPALRAFLKRRDRPARPARPQETPKE